MAVKKSRYRALRLNDEVARNLRHKKLPYTVGDLSQENVYLRVARTMKSVLVNVRVGGERVIKTIGQVTEDQPYEFWREQARQEVDRLKRQRLPRTASTPETPTLEDVMQQYFDAHPELKERSIESYRSEIERGFRYQLAQPITALTRIEILRLDREHRAILKSKDPKGRPPKGTYSWGGSLRALRTITRWWAATQNLPSPWPSRTALKIAVPKARELPHELNSAEGRQKLVEGLRAMDSTSARACLFVAYTGLRRKEATLLAASNLTIDGALQYESKTRSVTIPLSRQALALVDAEGTGSLLGVSEWSLRKPLIHTFGERETPRGREARVRPHDLRRLFETTGIELGISDTVIDKLMGHTIKGVRRPYANCLRIDVLREATQKISDAIDNPKRVGNARPDLPDQTVSSSANDSPGAQ